MSEKAKSISSKKTSGQDERLKEVSKLRLLLNRPELGAVGGAILVFIFFGIVAGGCLFPLVVGIRRSGGLLFSVGAPVCRRSPVIL